MLGDLADVCVKEEVRFKLNFLLHFRQKDKLSHRLTRAPLTGGVRFHKGLTLSGHLAQSTMGYRSPSIRLPAGAS